MSDAIAKEIDDLVEIGERLVREAEGASRVLGSSSVQVLSSLSTRGGQCIRRLYGSSSQHGETFQRILDTPDFSQMHGNRFRHVAELVGVLKAVQHDIRSGLLTDIRQQVRGEVFVDFLEMAEHLLEEGFKDASAVLLGAILEDTLRTVATAHGLSLAGANGQPLTMDPLNIALYKADVYSLLVQKQVSTWTTLRNNAAHGYFAKYNKTGVHEMCLFVQKFCSEYL